MANKILTIIFDTVEESLDAIIAAAVNEITKAGHTLKEIRLADDSGEVKVAANQVEGVVEPEASVETPVVDVPADDTVPDPDAPPEDEPVDPTQVTVPDSDSPSVSDATADDTPA